MSYLIVGQTENHGFKIYTICKGIIKVKVNIKICQIASTYNILLPPLSDINKHGTDPM